MSQSQERGRLPRRTLRLHPVHRPGDGTSGSERVRSALTDDLWVLTGLPFQLAIISVSC